jgi:hypothetical protein
VCGSPSTPTRACGMLNDRGVDGVKGWFERATDAGFRFLESE